MEFLSYSYIVFLEFRQRPERLALFTNRKCIHATSDNTMEFKEFYKTSYLPLHMNIKLLLFLQI